MLILQFCNNTGLAKWLLLCFANFYANIEYWAISPLCKYSQYPDFASVFNVADVFTRASIGEDKTDWYIYIYDNNNPHIAKMSHVTVFLPNNA